MRKLILPISLLLPFAAMAQTDPPKPSVDLRAMSDTVVDLTNTNIALRRQLIQAHDRIAELEKAAKAVEAPEKGGDSAAH